MEKFFNSLKIWIMALRIESLPLSLSAVILGGIIASRQGFFRWEVFICASITTLLLHILTNLANDYGDAVSGADSKNLSGPKRMIHSGILSLKQVKNAMIISALFAFFSGLVLIYVSFEGLKLGAFLFLILGIFAIGAAIRYTVGRNPYGYRGLGDIFVFLFFGIVGVAGNYFLHGHDWNWAVLLPASTIGFFVTGVLNINNIRDLQPDKESKKNTLVVKIGRNAALWYHFFLILSGWVCFLIFTAISGENKFLPMLTLPLFALNIWTIFTKDNPKKQSAEMGRLALYTILFVILNAV